MPHTLKIEFPNPPPNTLLINNKLLEISANPSAAGGVSSGICIVQNDGSETNTPIKV